MTRDERETFLAGLHIGVLNATDPDGAPCSRPVWYTYEPGGEILIATGRTSKKARLVRGNPAVSFLAQTEDLPYKYVVVEGTASVDEADVDAHVRPIARRYLGDELGDAYVTQTRAENPDGDVLIRITPEKWRTVDYAKR